MQWFWWIIGGIGAGGGATACAYGPAIDAHAARLFSFARQHLARLCASPPSASEDLALAGRLLSSLRAGVSLDAALEAAEAHAPAAEKPRLRQILHGPPPPDFFGAFLARALRTGVPCLAALQAIEKALAARRRLALRAHATTGQCRAQAEVLSWLPAALALGIAFFDSGWFRAALREPLAWFLWAIAVLLTGFGRQWMQRSLRRALLPRSAAQALEENALPDLTLRLVAELSQGIDAETALEQALAGPAHAELHRAFYRALPSHENHVARLRGLLQHAARTGAPVREELQSFQQDLQAEIEARWEERVQRLPIALLAPLFVCFFPCTLLVIASLLFPLLRGVF